MGPKGIWNLRSGRALERSIKKNEEMAGRCELFCDEARKRMQRGFSEKSRFCLAQVAGR
jgi:hypothetical protein